MMKVDVLVVGAGFSGFEIVSTNPALGRGGISNVALYEAAISAIPEPSVYAVLFAGLMAIGMATARRPGIRTVFGFSTPGRSNACA